MEKLNVVIAGAGIGGMTCAIAMLKNGFNVDVYEAALELSDVGAGITLAPNAMHGMQYLGLADEILSCAIQPAQQHLRGHKNGEVIRELDRSDMKEKYGAPYCYSHRADFHSILVKAVIKTGGRIHLASEIVDSGANEKAGWIQLANGEKVEGDIVVGADGLKSVIRRKFAPAPAKFTGHVAYRGLVPVNEPLKSLADKPGAFVGPERLVAFYPLRNGELINLVFLSRQSGWEKDGWTIPAERQELKKIYQGWAEPVQNMIANLDEGKLFKWAVNAHEPLEYWTLDDRLVLLGDAAHAMTPFLGQGAAMAIEDAVVLARSMKAATSIAEGLTIYETARRNYTAIVLEESNAHANRLQSNDSSSLSKKELRNEESLGLFNYDCGTVVLK